jgi:hypothetical protein
MIARDSKVKRAFQFSVNMIPMMAERAGYSNLGLPMISQHLLELTYIPLNMVLWGCDASALKQSHLDKLSAFHQKCA